MGQKEKEPDTTPPEELDIDQAKKIISTLCAPGRIDEEQRLFERQPSCS